MLALEEGARTRRDHDAVLVYSLLAASFEYLVVVSPEDEPGDEDGEWRLLFDGGSRRNPGITGAGAVLIHQQGDGWQIRWAGYRYLGSKSTNTHAEYASLVLGLEEVDASEPRAVIGDSQLILRHVLGSAQVHADHLKAWQERAQNLLERRWAFKFEHTYRQHNTMADWLANRAMTLRESKATSFDHTTSTDNDIRGQLLPLLT